MPITGPDVSGYQGAVDWPNVARTQAFAFTKATQGTGYVNPTFAANWRGIKAAGMVRGAYHFAGNGDPVAEAKFFYATVCAVEPPRPGDGMFLDLETGSGDLSGWAHAFFATLHSLTGLPDELYSGAYFFTSHNLTGVPCTRWVAAYGSTPSIRYDLFQFTNAASIPGIAGAVDQSSFDGTRAQLLALFGSTTGDDMSSTAAMKVAHAFVELAYDSLAHRGPDDQGRAYWIDQADKAMDDGVASWDALRDVLLAMRPAGGEFANDMAKDLARESAPAPAPAPAPAGGGLTADQVQAMIVAEVAKIVGEIKP